MLCSCLRHAERSVIVCVAVVPPSIDGTPRTRGDVGCINQAPEIPLLDHQYLLQAVIKPLIQVLVKMKFTPFASMCDQEVFVLFWVFQITQNFLLYSISATLLADFYIYISQARRVSCCTTRLQTATFSRCRVDGDPIVVAFEAHRGPRPVNSGWSHVLHHLHRNRDSSYSCRRNVRLIDPSPQFPHF